MGNIVTFYSYKGGVGRTMALANVAVLLAQWGYKILMVDWDLEAPGLEYYFSGYLNVEDVSFAQGVIDILYSGAEDFSSSKQPLDWKNLTVKIGLDENNGCLHLLTAGNRKDEYFGKVRNLDFKSFYDENQGGSFIERLRSEWKDAYDFILIDSRTGITDSGGICTIQLPDFLVLVFTATEQHLKGIMDVAKKINIAREELPLDRFTLLSIPIPSRFDATGEFNISQIWLDRFSRDLAELYASWLPRSVQRRDFLELTKIPYVRYFSYGEKLPVLEQGTIDPQGMGYAYETLAALIACKLESVEQLMGDRSNYVRKAREHIANQPQITEPQRSSERSTAHLISLDSDKDYPITQLVTRIGRKTSGTVPSIDLSEEKDGRTVSRNHAMILYNIQEGCWFLECNDRASNPIWVNEQVITQGNRTTIKDGDILRFGKAKMLFRIDNLLAEQLI